MKKLFSMLLAMFLLICVVGMIACAPQQSTPQTTVTAIEIDKLPTCTELSVGDVFSADGGTVKVTYSDGSTEIVSMTADEVELTKVNTNKVGVKTVTVTYRGQKTTFKVSVNERGYKVTYHLYDDKTEVAETPSNEPLAKSADPSREGYKFYGWYTDETCMLAYDFTQKVTSDITLYAEWKQIGATYYTVTFDIGYYGTTPGTYAKIVKSGNKAVLPSFETRRAEYRFDGWFDGATQVTADTVVTSDLTVVAKWTKTKTGRSTYVFEAENTDLTGKVGPGLSGTAQEEGLIVDGNETASGGRHVSYLYANGLSLEFYLACGEWVTDAKLTVRIAAEMDNINFNSDEFQVIVNGVSLSYADVRLTADQKFSDTIVISGVSLNKGANTIVLKTNNSRRPLGDASTYSATAPMVDCIKIETSAVVIWDANYKLPMEW